MNIRHLILAVCGAIILWPTIGHANCAGPVGVEGDQMYNDAYNMMQFCDGTDWKAMGGGGIADLTCGGIGGLCADGTIYAGLSPDGREHMFTTATSQTGLTWGPASDVAGLVNCPYPSNVAACTTGEANTAVLEADAGTFPAADYCAGLTAHGYSDWYLPSMYEMGVIMENFIIIGGFLPYAAHWSSTEGDATNARQHNGTEATVAKSTAQSVRCVRR